jgi:CRP/FNR family transcriptional regulator, cyclic AMP receptor protein
MVTIKEFLKQVELLMGLSDEALNQVAELCQSQRFEADTAIIERNSAADYFYLIREGAVKINPVFEPAEVPAKPVVVTLGQGQCFGEMSLVDRGTRSATVITLAPTQVLAIDCQRFLALCEQDTNIGYQVMRNIATDLSFKLRHRNLI